MLDVMKGAKRLREVDERLEASHISSDSGAALSARRQLPINSSRCGSRHPRRRERERQRENLVGAGDDSQRRRETSFAGNPSTDYRREIRIGRGRFHGRRRRRSAKRVSMINDGGPSIEQGSAGRGHPSNDDRNGTIVSNGSRARTKYTESCSDTETFGPSLRYELLRKGSARLFN